MGERNRKGAPEGDGLERLIFQLRGRRAMLDVDLARLYGVSTGRFNEAFKRNRDRFPEDFAFQLNARELADLRSQFAISSPQPAESPVKSEVQARLAKGPMAGAATRPGLSRSTERSWWPQC